MKRQSTLLRILALAALFIVFLLLERSSFEPELRPVHSGDAAKWSTVARHSVLSSRFYTATRPITVPLLHKLAGGNEELVVAVQSLFSVFAWFAAGLALALGLRKPITRAIALFACIGFSLTVPVNQWDTVIRSESIAFSLLALALALSIVYLRSLADGVPGWWIVIAWFVTCFLFVSTRDSVTYLIATLFVPLAGCVVARFLRRRGVTRPFFSRRELLLPLALLVVVVGFGRWSLTASQRWSTPLVNVLLNRVVSDPATYDFWVESYELPRNETFETFSGMHAWSRTDTKQRVRERLREDPALLDIKTWVLDSGMGSYESYLLRDNLAGSLAAAHRAFVSSINLINSCYAKGVEPGAVNRSLTTWLYHEVNGWRIVALWIAAIVTCCLILWRIPSLRLIAGVALWLLLNAWIQAFINYHGDDAEVWRHMMIVGVLYRLGLGVAILAVLDVGEARLQFLTDR